MDLIGLRILIIIKLEIISIKLVATPLAKLRHIIFLIPLLPSGPGGVFRVQLRSHQRGYHCKMRVQRFLQILQEAFHNISKCFIHLIILQTRCLKLIRSIYPTHECSYIYLYKNIVNTYCNSIVGCFKLDKILTFLFNRFYRLNT